MMAGIKRLHQIIPARVINSSLRQKFSFLRNECNRIQMFYAVPVLKLSNTKLNIIFRAGKTSINQSSII